MEPSKLSNSSKELGGKVSSNPSYSSGVTRGEQPVDSNELSDDKERVNVPVNVLDEPDFVPN